MPVPICVDLDGTLIRDDVTTIAATECVKRNIFNIFRLLFWCCGGIAHFKRRLSEVVPIDPTKLNYNEEFLEYLKKQNRMVTKFFWPRDAISVTQMQWRII